MNQTAQITTPQNARRIGVLLAGPGKLNVAVLKYLILHINTLQQTFEYEFLPTDDSDEFLQKLSTQTTVDRVEIAAGVHPFLQRHKQFLKEEIMGYDIRDTAIPDNLIIITMTRFEDKILFDTYRQFIHLSTWLLGAVDGSPFNYRVYFNPCCTGINRHRLSSPKWLSSSRHKRMHMRLHR